MKTTCENCEWYRFYDSAYGKCLRFPPQIKHNKTFKENTYSVAYPLVPYDNQACGEFKEA